MLEARNGLECACGALTGVKFDRPHTRQTFSRLTAFCRCCRSCYVLTFNWRLRRVVRAEPLPLKQA